MKKLFYLAALFLFFSCKYKEGLEYDSVLSRQIAKSPFKNGDVVFIKPDSLKGVITSSELTKYLPCDCGSTDTSITFYVRSGLTQDLKFKEQDFYRHQTTE